MGIAKWDPNTNFEMPNFSMAVLAAAEKRVQSPSWILKLGSSILPVGVLSVLSDPRGIIDPCWNGPKIDRPDHPYQKWSRAAYYILPKCVALWCICVCCTEIKCSWKKMIFFVHFLYTHTRTLRQGQKRQWVWEDKRTGKLLLYDLPHCALSLIRARANGVAALAY